MQNHKTLANINTILSVPDNSASYWIIEFNCIPMTWVANCVLITSANDQSVDGRERPVDIAVVADFASVWISDIFNFCFGLQRDASSLTQLILFQFII